MCNTNRDNQSTLSEGLWTSNRNSLGRCHSGIVRRKPVHLFQCLSYPRFVPEVTPLDTRLPTADLCSLVREPLPRAIWASSRSGLIVPTSRLGLDPLLKPRTPERHLDTPLRDPGTPSTGIRSSTGSTWLRSTDRTSSDAPATSSIPRPCSTDTDTDAFGSHTGPLSSGSPGDSSSDSPVSPSLASPNVQTEERNRQSLNQRLITQVQTFLQCSAKPFSSHPSSRGSHRPNKVSTPGTGTSSRLPRPISPV